MLKLTSNYDTRFKKIMSAFQASLMQWQRSNLTAASWDVWGAQHAIASALQAIIVVFQPIYLVWISWYATVGEEGLSPSHAF